MTSKKANRSRLLQKFGKAKAVNPFAEEEQRAIQNMAEGINVILDMHNSGELASLCGVLCLGTDGSNQEKKERVLAHIARQTQINHNPEKSYADVLHLMWEGVLFEYLRANGMPMRSVEHDPRVFTIIMWRKKATEQFGGTFRPHYMPRHTRSRTAPEKLDEDLRALLNGVAAKEIFVKESEKRVKRDNDYRNVVMYLAAVTDMHNYEEDCRQYLVGETEMLRARCDHQTESLELTALQMDELESTHAQMADQWCRTLAAQEANVDCYMGMLNENLCDKNALAIQIEDFLERHGGREGNLLDAQPGKRADLNELVCKMLARYDLDSRQAAEEVSGASKLLQKSKAELSKQSKALEFETLRANNAEKAIGEWKQRHRMLQDAAAARIAQLEIENTWLMAEAGSSFVESHVAARRFDLVRAQLDCMLGSGKSDEEAAAASLLEALGFMNREGVLQHLETEAMRREEVDQRTAAALVAAGAAGFAGKKKAGRKRG
jgi:hypothetical protein